MSLHGHHGRLGKGRGTHGSMRIAKLRVGKMAKKETGQYNPSHVSKGGKSKRARKKLRKLLREKSDGQTLKVTLADLCEELKGARDE